MRTAVIQFSVLSGKTRRAYCAPPGQEKLVRSKGRHIDLLLTKNNRTVAQFVGRLANRFYAENEAAQARLAALQKELEKTRAKAGAEKK